MSSSASPLFQIRLFELMALIVLVSITLTFMKSSDPVELLRYWSACFLTFILSPIGFLLCESLWRWMVGAKTQKLKSPTTAVQKPYQALLIRSFWVWQLVLGGWAIMALFVIAILTEIVEFVEPISLVPIPIWLIAGMLWTWGRFRHWV